MLHFCHQISYTNAAWTRVLQNPQDRFEAVRATIESLGGKIDAAFFTMDSYDVLAITEFPDGVSPASIAIAFSAGGEVAHIHSTKLLDASEALEAMHKAGQSSGGAVPHSRSRVVPVS
jgi:uncharacterized protein with GYD domain